jgi:hypothetical protein
MRRTNRKPEKGVALLLALLALMLLSAIAAGMMFMSSTETSIGANFKSEEQAYFSARAGIEEVRDRMLVNNPNTINASLPTALPTAGGGVLYVTQNGVTNANITGLGSSLMADDELCHDFSYGGMTSVPANVRCTTLPGGTGWFTTTASVAPYALDYKWVRVTLKANSSAPYLVDSAQAGNLQACWNGTSEVVAPSGTACSALPTTSSPVYLVTALAMTSSGARRIVQQEIGQKPIGTFPGGGLFATGTGCGALNIAGNSQTGSFNSAAESTPTNPPSNQTNSNGNVGANGNVSVGGTSANVNGTISTNDPAIVGPCPDGVTVAGGAGIGAVSNFPTPYTPPVPPIPNPLPPVNNVIEKNKTLTPGAYGNVTIQGTVHLMGGTVAHPAVYTINSLVENGNATLVINGPVVLNLAGIGVTTVLDLTGGSFSNTTYIPSDFQINYGGTDTMLISGGNQAFAVIDAPNANITFKGGSDFYGQAIGNTINVQGGVNFYWDTSLATPPPINTNTFHEIALRELSY